MSSEITHEEDIFLIISTMSKDIARESKELFDLALEQSQASEEEIVPGLKAVSLKAHKMLALLNAYLKSYNDRTKTSGTVHQQFLLDSSKGVTRAMLEFVQARKSLFSNPFDYLSQQTLANALKGVILSNKDLLSALDAFRQYQKEEDDSDDDSDTHDRVRHTDRLDMSSRTLSSTSTPVISHVTHTSRPPLTSMPSAASFFAANQNRPISEPRTKPINVINDTESVTIAAQKVEDAVLNKDGEKFYKAVKDFVEAVNRLFDIIKMLSIDLQEIHLREAAVFLVNSGRAVMNAPEDDDVCSTTFGEAVNKMDQVVRSFVYTCSKSVAGRQSIRASVKVAPAHHLVTPPSPTTNSSPHSPSYSSQTERSYPLHRQFLSKSTSEEMGPPSRSPSEEMGPPPPPISLEEGGNRTGTGTEKKSKSNPSLAVPLRNSGSTSRITPPSSPEIPDPSNNWERAEAVKRSMSRPAISIAHPPQQVVVATPALLGSANNAQLLGLNRLVPSPSTPIGPVHSPDREKVKAISRSLSVQMMSTATSPREREDQAVYDIALTVAEALCERYPSFDEEWKRQTQVQREATLDKIVQIMAKTSNIPTLPASLPPPPLPPKPRNRPDAKTESKVESHSKNADPKSEYKGEKGGDKGDKSGEPLHLLTRDNSAPKIDIFKSSTGIPDESMSQLQEFTSSAASEWIMPSDKIKRGRGFTSTFKKKSPVPRNSSPAWTHFSELANGLETSMSEFLRLINSSILNHATYGTVVSRNSSINPASIESLSTSITGMRDNLREVIEAYMKSIEDALTTNEGAGSKLSEGVSKLGESGRSISNEGFKTGKSAKWEKKEKKDKKEKSTVAQQDLLQRMLGCVSGALEAIPLKGKSNDAMVSALAAATVNFINTKLRMEDTLEENICSECVNLRGCVAQIVVELRANVNMNATDLSMQTALFQLASASNLFVETMKKILDSIATLRYVLMSEATSFTGSIKINDGTSDDVNIWEDTTEILYSDGVFRAGNLNKLVETLTSAEQLDNKYLSTFITTYQSFTTPAEFFAKLVQRYNVPANSGLKEGIVKAIKVRVCIVLKYWIETQFMDFDQDIVAKLFNFIKNALPEDGNGTVGQALSRQLTTKVNEVNAKRNAMVILPLLTIGLDTNMSPSAMFMTFSATDIAKQLTLIEYTLFSKIHPAELLGQSWNSRTARQNSTHVLDLIQRTNRLSFWIGSLLLWQPSLSLRMKILLKIISVGQALRELNNFNTLMGIVAGLSMSAINRLKITFKNLDSKPLENLEKLQMVLNPGMSFKYYRAELAASKGACLPYLGTILSDLTFMEDGNPNTVTCPKTKKQLVNYSKRELINNVIREITLHQQLPYLITRMDPLTSFLEALPCTEDKELYELSLLREPREVKTLRNIT